MNSGADDLDDAGALVAEDRWMCAGRVEVSEHEVGVADPGSPDRDPYFVGARFIEADHFGSEGRPAERDDGRLDLHRGSTLLSAADPAIGRRDSVSSGGWSEGELARGLADRDPLSLGEALDVGPHAADS